MNLIRRLYEMPPKEAVRKLGRKLRRSRHDRPQLADILASPKALRSQRPYDFLSRYETIIGRHHDWPNIDFSDRSVIEIGCGPMLGWAPLAVFLGCRRYTCVEPYIDLEVLRAPQLVEGYFLGLHRDLTALYGPHQPFEAFLADLFARVEVVDRELLAADITGPYDVMLSNSCLEHIFPLEPSLARLKELAANDCRFIHLVDFGNHRSRREPFAGLYEVEPEAYLATHGRGINLLRGVDVLRCFRDQGFAATLVPYYSAEEFYQGEVAEYWSDRYQPAELFLKVALIAGPLED
jgi:hypothetical protein